MHLGLWDQKVRPPPEATGQPKIQEYKIDYSIPQLPLPARRLSGGSDKWLYVDPEPAVRDLTQTGIRRATPPDIWNGKIFILCIKKPG